MTEPQADIPYLNALEPAARTAFGRAPDLAAISQAISLRRIADALEQLTRASASAGGNVYGRAAYGYDPSNFVGGGVAGSPNTTLFTVGPGGSSYPPIGDSPAERVGGSAADPRGIHRTFDPEGWQDWHGGECPVPDETLVEIKLRQPPFGRRTETAAAGNYKATDAGESRDWWQHTGAWHDIVAWRLAK